MVKVTTVSYLLGISDRHNDTLYPPSIASDTMIDADREIIQLDGNMQTFCQCYMILVA